MNFGTPQALWLFLAIPFFVLLHYMSFSDMGPFQRRFSLFLRMLLITSLILALADARLIKRSDQLSVIFLWDASQSMGESSEQAMWDYIHESLEYSDIDTDKAALVAFAKDAFVETGLGSDLSEISDIESDLTVNFTDLSGAIDLAVASLPPDSGARLVILSDGNENIGDSLTSARVAANRGIEIDVMPFGEPTEGEVAAGRIILPRRVEEGETFDVRAVIEAQAETDATVAVYENGQLMGEQRVHLVPGKNVFTFPQQHNEGGFYSYEVQVSGVTGDTTDANNRATDYTIVQGQPKVCYVSGDPLEAPNLVNALSREGIQTQYRDLSGLPTSLIDMAQYDVIFFSDIGAELLMPDTMAAYQAYVRDLGNAFVMLGGVNSFGPGGYFHTPIEEMLPVDLDITKKDYMPSIAIALVIDSSGSMGMVESDGSQKVEIAKKACALVAELLDYTDQMCVIAFDFSAQPVVNMTTVDDPDRIIEMIGHIRPGGGTDVYPGMMTGFNQLQGADAKIRHMIILSDFITAPGDFDGAVDRMNSNDMTLTTIAVGSDANLLLAERMATRGGGNFYRCNTYHAVPQIFTKETFLSANRALVEETFQAAPNMYTPVTDGINWQGAPPLLGYVVTNIKPLATEGLVTHNMDPLLAHWQYGLGRSLAFTSDAKAHWAAGWLNWDGYQQMWTQATRWLVGGTMQGNMVPNIFIRGGMANISVDAINVNGEMITDADIRARVIRPDMDSSEVDLFQVAPGRYQASVPATQIGSYLVNIFQEDVEGSVIDQVSSGFSVSYPPEYENSGPNLFLLTQLTDATGGVLNPDPSEIFKHTNQPVTNYMDLWFYLLALFICLLPIDIAFRRLSFTGETLEYVRAQVKVRFKDFREARARGREKPTYIEDLRKIKEQYRLRDRSGDSPGSDADVDSTLARITQSTRKRSDITVSDKSQDKRDVKSPDKSEDEPESSLDRLKRAKKRTWE